MQTGKLYHAPFLMEQALTVPESTFIDCLEFAEQSLEIHGKIRASNLLGLQDFLYSDLGKLEYRLAGGRLWQDKLALLLEVQGLLTARCQCCLGEMDYPVHIARIFVLVADESALPDEEFDDDEVDYLVSDPKLGVEALIEEEILLSLPLVLRHKEDCTGDIALASVGKPSLFQALAGLKIPR
jgi:uncharacterized protein